MKTPTLAQLTALALFVASPLAADTAGEAEYMNSCAVCHGADGTGGGPLAGLMTVPLPDLTQIAASNDGEFPFLKVIQIIDGRTGVRGHGYPMPVWGNRFATEAGDVGPMATELEVRGRVLSLAYFLESIQQ